MSSLLVRVDLSRCTAAGDCADICPEVFSLDRYGYPVLSRARLGEAATRARVREAGARCPKGAMRVEEVDAG